MTPFSLDFGRQCARETVEALSKPHCPRAKEREIRALAESLANVWKMEKKSDWTPVGVKE